MADFDWAWPKAIDRQPGGVHEVFGDHRFADAGRSDESDVLCSIDEIECESGFAPVFVATPSIDKKSADR